MKIQLRPNFSGKLNIYDAISADLIIIADFLKVEALKQRCADLSRGLPLDQALKLVVKCEGKTSGRIYRTVFYKYDITDFMRTL